MGLQPTYFASAILVVIRIISANGKAAEKILLKKQKIKDFALSFCAHLMTDFEPLLTL